MSLICLIPARGGSKGLPDKNLRPIGGVSLVGRSVQAAADFIRMAGLTDATIVVDTDSETIAEEARRWGARVPFLRPPALAADTTSTVESSLAALERLERDGFSAETVVLLQPTSPLRSAEDILACWSAYSSSQRPSVISVALTEHPADLALRLTGAGTVEWHGKPAAATRRQELADTYWPSGAVYVSSVAFLRREQSFIVSGLTVGVVLPRSRSVDIDTAEDLALAEIQLVAGPTSTVRLGSTTIGPGHPCFVIAEAGVNHNGDPALAHRLVDAASAAGADAVKFQTFDPEQLAAADAPKAAYQIANTGSAESQLEMLRRLALPREALEPLAAHARDKGLLFLSTPFDAVSADFLDGLGVPGFKVPSGEVTNLSFLAYLARKGRPMLVSTGMSTLSEVATAVSVVRASGNPPLALFHCVTNYPAAPADCNLRAIETMRRAFGVPVGWSDHTEGFYPSIAAVAAGASLLEKHFTLDRSLPGPDHRASLEPGELIQLVAAVRETEATLGDGIKRPAPSEAANARLVRRSVHAARPLPAGHVLAPQDLVALRPGNGLPPSTIGRLVGRSLRVELARGEMLREEHLV
ncbi:MAG: N-acetylneuraminate synthase [Gemmatimonadales bacterium]